jgi:hypothetical protein
VSAGLRLTLAIALGLLVVLLGPLLLPQTGFWFVVYAATCFFVGLLVLGPAMWAFASRRR